MRLFNQRGFTLVEIMVVVAIIAVLASIAIPNLLRAKVTSNDAMAQSTLRTMSSASETFYALDGLYPTNFTSLTTGSNPSYVATNYCGQLANGFTFTCTNATTTYTYTATPSTIGITGTTTYSITVGGLLTP